MIQKTNLKFMYLALCFAGGIAQANELNEVPYSSCKAYCEPYVEVDFLYWKAHEDAIPYATMGFNIGPTPPSTMVHEVNWNWKPGFRVGLGTVFGCNDVDLSLTYTWFRSHAKDSIYDPSASTLGIWSSANPAQVILANADWTLQFQTLDLALGKNFCLGNCFVIKPILALRGAHTKDIYDLNYFSAFDISNNVHNMQGIWAIGPLGGVNANFSFLSNWSIIGEAAFSFLWSDYKILRMDTGNSLPHQELDHKFSTLRTLWQFRLGIGWDRDLCCNGYHLSCLLAWEQLQWVDHNQMIYGPINFSDYVSNRNSNLNLYGITLRAQLSF